MIAAMADLPNGFAKLENSKPPTTPFAATMQERSQNWINDFLAGIGTATGYTIVPVSDALTPPVAVTGTADTGPLAGANGNTVLTVGALALAAFVAYKLLK